MTEQEGEDSLKSDLLALFCLSIPPTTSSFSSSTDTTITHLPSSQAQRHQSSRTCVRSLDQDLASFNYIISLVRSNSLVCLRHLQQRKHCVFSCGSYVPWNVHARTSASSCCTKTRRLGCHTNSLATCSMILDQDMSDRCASLKHGQAHPL